MDIDFNTTTTIDQKIIKLNIGGTLFYTTIGTLLNQSETMFSAMFGGKFHADYDVNNEYFFDRNPAYFGIILDYMRGVNVVDLIESYSFQEKKLFIQELAYYGMNNLINSLEIDFLETGLYEVESKHPNIKTFRWKIKNPINDGQNKKSEIYYCVDNNKPIQTQTGTLLESEEKIGGAYYFSWTGTDLYVLLKQGTMCKHIMVKIMDIRGTEIISWGTIIRPVRENSYGIEQSTESIINEHSGYMESIEYYEVRMSMEDMHTLRKFDRLIVEAKLSYTDGIALEYFEKINIVPYYDRH